MKHFQIKDSTPQFEIGQVLEIDTKQLTETGEFEGYASTYGNIDNGGDIVRSGAFDESLRSRPADRVRFLWQHDSRKPIGTWLQISSDSKGLFVRGKLLLSTQSGKEAYELLKVNAVDGLSIGFRTIESEFDSENDIRTITKADLREVSIVTFAMNEMATISMVKNFEFNPREAERVMRKAGLSSNDAVTAIAVMKKYLRRDAEGNASAAARDETGAMNGLLDAIKHARADLST